jgi:Domain of unknown function (DUF4177)
VKGGVIMKKYEYKVFTHNASNLYSNDDTIVGALNKLGHEGWELVSTVPVVKGSGSEGDVYVETDDIKFLLKREV